MTPCPPCVRPKKTSVCRCKTSPCVPAPRAHVVTHVRVVPVHTGDVLHLHTEVFFCVPSRATPHHTHHTNTTTHNTTRRQRDTETETDRNRERDREKRQKQRETERDRERETRQDKKRQDKTRKEKTRQ